MAVDRFTRNDGSAIAGYIAFSGLLSIFPFLIFAATLTGILLGNDRSEEIIKSLFQIAPEHIAQTIEPVVVEVLNKQSGEVLTLSALFAIWVASSAFDGFRIAFDRAYAVPDPRGFIENRAMAIALVFLGALVAALLGVTIVFSPLILRVAEHRAERADPAGLQLLHLRARGRWSSSASCSIMHRVLPGRRLKGFRLWPGVIVTTVLWVAMAVGFSIYLTYTPTYTVTYGTLAGVIITLMFFYFSGATIIYGAEVNAALNRIGVDR